MTAAGRYRSLWGEADMVPYPREEWLAIGFPASALPEGDEIPLDVEVVYTGFLDGDIELYDQIQLAAEDGSVDVTLIVVGTVADEKNLLYVLDPGSGEILQLDRANPRDVQGVNSNFRCFVEFLYHFQQFVNADQGRSGRATLAASLRENLIRIDPNAFDEDAWWPMVFAQLMS